MTGTPFDALRKSATAVWMWGLSLLLWALVVASHGTPRSMDSFVLTNKLAVAITALSLGWSVQALLSSGKSDRREKTAMALMCLGTVLD